jgi:hypothetical protein
MKKEEIGFHKDACLHDQLLEESLAMAEHALAAGMNIAPKLLRTLDSLDRASRGLSPTFESSDTSSSDHMKEKTDPPQFRPGDAVNQLTTIHERLAHIVEPAKPRSILLIANENENKSFRQFLGPLPLVRQMMFAALVSTMVFILLGMSVKVNSDPNAGSVLTSFGWDLLCNELFFLAAAGVGASFAALFKANRYIVEGTFEPKYQSSYWIRFLLGLISGLILACLVPVETSSSTFQLSKPLLALLGGFSSDVVYRILTRQVSAVETLVSGETRDIIAAQAQESKARFSEQTIQHRFKIASDLIRVQQQIRPGDKPETIKAIFENILNDLLPRDAELTPSNLGTDKK